MGILDVISKINIYIYNTYIYTPHICPCFYKRGGGIVNINKSRAISTTRTVFRLNTNQNHAYEDYLLKYNNTLLLHKY